jgi:hypothetical protein
MKYGCKSLEHLAGDAAQNHLFKHDDSFSENPQVTL